MGGGEGDWYDAGRWITAAPDPNFYPLPGDTVRVASGIVRLVGREARTDHTFDDATVRLGSDDSARPAELLATSAIFQIFFDVTAPAARFARFATIGTSQIDGFLTVDGRLTLDAERRTRAEPSAFVITTDAAVTVADQGRLRILGTVKLETTPGEAVVRSGGTLVNDGDIDLAGSELDLSNGAAWTGRGSVHLGLDSVLSVATAAPSSQTVTFDQPGAVLKIGEAGSFKANITDVRRGDQIDLEDVSADYAGFDAATGLFDLKTGGADGTVVAALHLQTSSPDALRIRPDGSGGTDLYVARSQPLGRYDIAAGDRAMRSDRVRATMTTSTGAPIDGSGVKIGIISDSFDARGGADSAAAAGYLPYDAATGTAAVTVLKDDPSGDDEGQAMAELVHQVAPGAQIYFSTGDPGPNSFAAAVDALRKAGCTVIADDLGYASEPYFQVAGPLDDAIQRAVHDGVSYFTAAGNAGNAFYQADFDPIATALRDDPAQIVLAQRFGDGTPYQTITLTGGETAAIDVQWDAAYPQDGVGVPDALVAKLYDMQGDLIQTSHQVTAAGVGVPEVEISLKTPSALYTQYQIAIYHVDGTPAVGQFSTILNGFGGGSGPGGFFDDPEAEQGAGTATGHDVIPDANVVGAADWANSPTFGTNDFTEGYSSSGPGDLLFDANGQRLAAPVSAGKVDFIAPDGVSVDTRGFRPFDGTSAAAPNAAAVAALMLQANPDLTPKQVTVSLEASAADMGLPAAQQGAGFIQADRAVALAQDLAAPDLAFDPLAPPARHAHSIGVSGTSDAIGQTVTVLSQRSGKDLGHARVAADGTWSTTIRSTSSGSRVLEADVSGTGQSAAKAEVAVHAADPATGLETGATFVFKAHPGQNNVTGFEASGARHDVISLAAADFVSVAAVLRHTAVSDGNAVITIAHDASITLDGVTKHALARRPGDIVLHA